MEIEMKEWFWMNTTEGNGQEMKIEKQIFFKKREWNEKKR